jgi:hypothetical protein
MPRSRSGPGIPWGSRFVLGHATVCRGRAHRRCLRRPAQPGMSPQRGRQPRDRRAESFRRQHRQHDGLPSGTRGLRGCYCVRSLEGPDFAPPSTTSPAMSNRATAATLTKTMTEPRSAVDVALIVLGIDRGCWWIVLSACVRLARQGRQGRSAERLRSRSLPPARPDRPVPRSPRCLSSPSRRRSPSRGNHHGQQDDQSRADDGQLRRGTPPFRGAAHGVPAVVKRSMGASADWLTRRPGNPGRTDRARPLTRTCTLSWVVAVAVGAVAWLLSDLVVDARLARRLTTLTACRVQPSRCRRTVEPSGGWGLRSEIVCSPTQGGPPCVRCD